MPTENADLIAILEETLAEVREMRDEVRRNSAATNENLTLTRGMEIQFRTVADTVAKHDVSLYHADEGGIVGRLGRIEDRLNAKIDSLQKETQAKIDAAKNEAEKRDADTNAKIKPVIWVGGVFALVFVGYAANGVLAAIVK